MDKYDNYVGLGYVLKDRAKMAVDRGLIECRDQMWGLVKDPQYYHVDVFRWVTGLSHSLEKTVTQPQEQSIDEFFRGL